MTAKGVFVVHNESCVVLAPHGLGGWISFLTTRTPSDLPKGTIRRYEDPSFLGVSRKRALLFWSLHEMVPFGQVRGGHRTMEKGSGFLYKDPMGPIL